MEREESTVQMLPVGHSTNVPWHTIQIHSQTNMHTVDTVLLVFGLEASQFNTFCKLLSQCIYMFQGDKFNLFMLKTCLLFLLLDWRSLVRNNKKQGWHKSHMTADRTWPNKVRIRQKLLWHGAWLYFFFFCLTSSNISSCLPLLMDLQNTDLNYFGRTIKHPETAQQVTKNMHDGEKHHRAGGRAHDTRGTHSLSFAA